MNIFQNIFRFSGLKSFTELMIGINGNIFRASQGAGDQ